MRFTKTFRRPVPALMDRVPYLLALTFITASTNLRISAGEPFYELLGGNVNLQSYWSTDAQAGPVDCFTFLAPSCEEAGLPMTPEELVTVHEGYKGTDSFVSCACGVSLGDVCANAVAEGGYGFLIAAEPDEFAIRQIRLESYVESFASGCDGACYAACAYFKQCFGISLVLRLQRPSMVILRTAFPAIVSATSADWNGIVHPDGPTEARGVVLRNNTLTLETRHALENAEGAVDHCSFDPIESRFTDVVLHGLITLRFQPLENGDLDCDGAVIVNDVLPFVTALVNPTQYDATFAGCDRHLADFTRDGAVTVSDVSGFVSRLLGN
ncbi:MAG: hypothetical protein AB7N71_07940 [Phycisphaerae bacterium]